MTACVLDHLPAELHPVVRACAADAGVRLDDLGAPVPSWSNLALPVADHAFLRVCHRGAVERLTAEAHVLAELPPEVGHPELLAFGAVEQATWTLARRQPGVVLNSVWDALDPREREAAIDRVAECADALYGHRPSAATIAALEATQASEDLIGKAMVAWPLTRVDAVLEGGTSVLPDELGAEIREALAALDARMPRVDAPGLGVVHGDLHSSNIWFHDGRVTGLFDLEWVRLGEPSLELAHPWEKVLADRVMGRDLHPTVVPGLIERLPALRVDADVRAGIALAYVVRQSTLWEPFGPDSPPDHCVRLARELLDQIA